MNEITAAIRVKALGKYKPSNMPSEFWMNASKDDIIGVELNDLSIDKQREAYTCGGEDAIESLFKKNDFLKWAYDKIAQWNWQENNWTVKTSSGLDYNKGYTTEQLLLKYMEETKYVE